MLLPYSGIEVPRIVVFSCGVRVPQDMFFFLEFFRQFGGFLAFNFWMSWGKLDRLCREDRLFVWGLERRRRRGFRRIDLLLTT